MVPQEQFESIVAEELAMLQELYAERGARLMAASDSGATGNTGSGNTGSETTGNSGSGDRSGGGSGDGSGGGSGDGSGGGSGGGSGDGSGEGSGGRSGTEEDESGAILDVDTERTGEPE